MLDGPVAIELDVRQPAGFVEEGGRTDELELAFGPAEPPNDRLGDGGDAACVARTGGIAGIDHPGDGDDHLRPRLCNRLVQGVLVGGEAAGDL
jgi:hypothetical protein